MSATELDLPVFITSEQIRRREFVTTRRGYDPDQVRDYLDALAEQVDVMATMIREARLEAEASMRSDAQPKADPYEQLARRVSSVIREADEAAERFRMDGRRDAERLMTEARADAERIRTDAQSTAQEARRQAEQALEDARQQADRTIAGLSTRRDALVDQLAQMQERLLGVARDLEATIVTPEIAAAPAGGETSPSGSAVVGWPSEIDPAAEDPATSSERQGDPSASVPAAPPAPRIVDVRPNPPADAVEAMSIEELFADLDGGQAALWDGTDLAVPDIPPLDLDWGDVDEDDDRS